MSRIVPLAVGCVLIVATTLVEGYITQRWTPGATKELKEMVEGYAKIPKKIGDWECDDTQSEEAQLREKAQMKAASAHAYISRRYKNNKGEAIYVTMLCGFARHVAVHTPDRCLTGQGFTKEDEPQKLSLPIGNTPATFYYARFKPSEKIGGFIKQRTYWAWNGGDGWQAPDFPRLKYPARSALNKLYLTWYFDKPGEEPKPEVVAAFAKLFMPKLNEAFAPPAS